MSDPKTQKVLHGLYQILEAGEKGYATAATNVHWPGLKILFKRFAQQRAAFKTEILSALHNLEDDKKPSSSIPGMVHRGRVAIFAAMTIEKDNQEKVILKEIALGEGVAVRSYTKALANDLPPQIHEMVERQSEAIRKAREQISLLYGKDGKKLVVHLYNTENDAGKAIQLIKETDTSAEVIQQITLKDADLYPGKGATVLETVLSGAVGGALWAGLTGILVGFGVVQSLGQATAEFPVMLGTWLLVALGFMLLGIFISSVLALFIGLGIHEDDLYQYHEIVDNYQILVNMLVDQALAVENG
jgi:uncharacterized protein (TIGR02284 family)